MSPKPEPTKERVQMLQADAAKMLEDLSALSTQLRAVTKEKAEDLGDEASLALEKQVKALQEAVAGFTKDSEKILGQLDKSIRANPYLYLAGAVGVGLMLGKALRS